MAPPSTVGEVGDEGSFLPEDPVTPLVLKLVLDSGSFVFFFFRNPRDGMAASFELCRFTGMEDGRVSDRVFRRSTRSGTCGPGKLEMTIGAAEGTHAVSFQMPLRIRIRLDVLTDTIVICSPQCSAKTPLLADSDGTDITRSTTQSHNNGCTAFQREIRPRSGSFETATRREPAQYIDNNRASVTSGGACLNPKRNGGTICHLIAV